MRIASNQGVGASTGVPYHNEPNDRSKKVLMWGTVTNVDLQVSPDGGTTWVTLQNFTAAGSADVVVPSADGYEVRINVTTGSGVYCDVV